MPGFYIAHKEADIELNNIYNERCVKNGLFYDDLVIKRNTLNKFMDDKVFYEDDDYIIITEGVILNKTSLVGKYGGSDFIYALKAMIKENEDTFYNQFRGSFSGAVCYKNKNKWIIYTNHVGDKAIFYYNDKNNPGKFVIGSQANYVIDGMNKLGINRTIDEKAVYYMLTYAFMADDSTYANEIKRLRPGHFLTLDEHGLKASSYHAFRRTYCKETFKLTEEEVIDVLDEKFRAAIKLEYDKDNEYGYKHLSDLSGGLDSRMSTWVARDMGYTNFLNITYSQSNYLDEIIAKQIAACLNNELIFKQLDEASFLYDIEKIVSMNFGTALYAGITGGQRLLECLNMDEFGLEHTGQLGDVIIGSYLNDANTLHSRNVYGYSSDMLLNNLDKKHVKVYEDSELYRLYVRGFNGILSTHLIRQNYIEVASAFIDVDFLEFCLSIPLELRAKHYLYKKWILSKYPLAAKYKWEAINGKITSPRCLLFLKRVIIRGPRKFLKIIGIINKRDQAKKLSMNPLDYWLKTNKDLEAYLIGFFEKHIYENELRKDVKEDIKRLFNTGSAIEKTMALTALEAITFYMS